jgi:hypothetical protein
MERSRNADCALVAYSPVSRLPVEAADSFAASEWLGEAIDVRRLAGNSSSVSKSDCQALTQKNSSRMEQDS